MEIVHNNIVIKAKPNSFTLFVKVKDAHGKTVFDKKGYPRLKNIGYYGDLKSAVKSAVENDIITSPERIELKGFLEIYQSNVNKIVKILNSKL